jgi:hypothetical protein
MKGDDGGLGAVQCNHTHTEVMNCPVTDVDFVEGSLQFIKINQIPSALFIIYNSSDSYRRDVLCASFQFPSPSQLKTIYQTHIPLTFFFTHFLLVKRENPFFIISTKVGMINMICVM